jgi:hypothetical protein
MIDVGIASVAMTVVRQSRMNSRIVAETSTAASSRWNSPSSIGLDDEPRLVADDLGGDVRRQRLAEVASRRLINSTP